MEFPRYFALESLSLLSFVEMYRIDFISHFLKSLDLITRLLQNEAYTLSSIFEKVYVSQFYAFTEITSARFIFPGFRKPASRDWTPYPHDMNEGARALECGRVTWRGAGADLDAVHDRVSFNIVL